MGPDRYEYFSFKTTDADADLSIAVTPFTGGGWALCVVAVAVACVCTRNFVGRSSTGGLNDARTHARTHPTHSSIGPYTQTDPDVFVSPAPRRPNSTDHEWAAMGFGGGEYTRRSGWLAGLLACMHACVRD